MNRITVDAKAFTKELEWCARFVERKSTIPVLTNVMLRKSGEQLYLTGTDLETAGITSVEADGPDFELTVPVLALLKYLKKVDDRTLILNPDIDRYPAALGPHVSGCNGSGTSGCCTAPSIRGVKLSVSHGTDGDGVTVEGMAADAFPVLPERPLSCVEIGRLEAAIPRVCLAISAEETRFTLHGALLQIGRTPQQVIDGVDEEAASLVSTDGHRLSIADIKLFDSPKAPFTVLIPKAALLELARLGDSAYLSHDEHHAFFTVGQRTIVARKLTGSFPDWERVMPKDLKHVVTIPSAALRKVLDRISLFADERSHAVEFTVNGALEVVAETIGNGRAQGKVAIIGPDFAYPYTAGFNANYVTDFLKTASAPEFRFRFHKSANAIQCDVPGWKYVVMPMRTERNTDPVLVGEFEPVPAVIEALERAERERAVDDSFAGRERLTVSYGSTVVATVPGSVIATPAGERVDAPAVARMLNINHATVYNWVKRGKLPSPIKVGRAMTWARVDIEALDCAEQRQNQDAA